MRAALSSWRKQAADLQKLLADSQDVEELRRARDDLHSKMSDLTSVFNRMLEIAPDYTTSPLGSQYENVEKENLQIGKEVCRTIRELDGESSSVGSRSSVVSRASSISKRADIASEAAGLKAKLKYYDEIEKRKVELGKMKMIRNLEIAEAQIEAVKRVECEEGMNLGFGEKPASASLAPQDKEQYVEDFVQTTLDHVISEQDVSPEQLLSVQAPEFRPQRSNESVEVHNPQTPTRPPDTQILDITKSITEQILLSRLPPPEPGIFSGDPIAYPGWKSAFETLVDRRGIPRSERMHYLKRYLGGSAKEAIEGYFLVCNDDSYEEAKRLLERRYGDPFLVATAFRNRLDNWPKLSPRDGHGLRRLADFLRQCDSAMNTFDSLNVLNDDREMQKVLNKLPDWLVSRWCRLVVEWKEKYMRLPPFREFMKFVEKEANIACDPTMSLQAVRGSTLNDIEKREKYFKPSQNDQKRVIRNTLSTETLRVEKQNRDRNTQKKGLCALCSKNHFINECEQFLSKSMDERKDIIMTRGLCYGCLRRGHRSRECPEKSVCDVCSKRHPSSLHGDFKKDCAENGPETKEPFHVHSSNEPAQRHQNNRMVQSKTTRADVNGTESASMCSMILPVYVSHWQDPSNEVLTYAPLDTQSDTTFVVSSVCEALGVNGPSVKLIMSTMSSQAEPVDSRKIKGLRVRGHNSQTTISLPPSYTQRLIPGNKSHIPTPEVARRFEHLSQISDELMPLLNVPMGLVIGYDCAQAFTPREVIAQGGMEPYAQRTDLGWGIVGVTNPHLINDEESDPYNHFGYSHRIMTLGLPNDTLDVLSSAKTHQEAHVILSSQVSVKETMTPNDVSRMLELDFVDHGSQSEKMISQEDKKFLSLMEKGIHQTADGHYEMPLPVKDPCLELPNNRNQAENRLKHLKGRFLKDERFYQDYKKFMDSMIESGYAEVVDDSEVAKSNLVWYIPHHGVYHPQKPHKIRVVFDCSSRFQGHCLNDHLMQGPDLMNSLVGVLCRFRQEEIAFICDVEQMFFQFGVNAEHRDLLRFLWWEDGVYDKDPVVYRMSVHLFGATSSPGCANFGMKTIANDFKEIHGTDAANFLKRYFYVDDGLGSRSTPGKAVELIQATRQMCKNGGLRLHKFASNSREVLQCLPEQDRATNLQKIDLLTDHLPLERALGVQWCVQSDTFQFHITLKDQPLTRRGILSSISSIYDPLGFLAPVILVGKQILQQMVKEQTDWDAELPDDIRTKWEQWSSDLFYLKDFQVPRCLKPPATDLDEDHCAELHHFSDASSTGYGQVTYLRLKDSQKQVHCAFVMAKSRVAPVRTMTIPRLELTAAVVSVRMSNLLQGELDFGEVKHVFWTDSKIVLGYISNESRRFHVFVANRIEQIKRHTNTDQWNYVASSDNPADTVSRGLTARQLVLSETWLRGPKFLLQENIPEVHAEDAELNWIEDPEVKPVKSLSTSAEVSQNAFDLKHFENFSSYSRLRRAVANCIRIQQIFKHRRTSSLCVGDLQFAEREITRLVQSSAFSEEMKLLSSAEKLDGDRKRDDVSRRKRLTGFKGWIHSLMTVLSEVMFEKSDVTKGAILLVPRRN